MKKLLFIFLLLIPFTVQAINYDNLNLKWQIEKTYEEYKERYASDSYEMENTFIFFSEEKLMSIDKNTGETKIVDVPSIHLKSDDVIIGLKYDNNVLKYYVYDEYLNIIIQENLGNMIVSHFKPYDENYYLLICNGTKNGKRVTKLFFIDKEGNFEHTDEKQLNNSIKYYINYSTNEKMLLDDNYNAFYIEDYQIKPSYTNSDGSYMYQENTKLSKVSPTGEVIDVLELPEGQSADITKMGDYYYVASAIYEIIDTKKVLINLKIYKIDENLNIIKTTTTNNTEPRIFNNNYYDSYDTWLHAIYNKDGHVYCKYEYSNSKTKYYEIDENLNLIDLTSTPYFNYYEYRYDTSANDDSYSPLTEKPSSSIERELKYRVQEEYPEYEEIEFRKTEDNNYYAIVNLEKRVTNSDGRETYYKGILKCYDVNLNEKFSIELFDWTLYYRSTQESFDYYIYPETRIYYIDDYLLLTIRDPMKNHIVIIDKQGNIIKDLSNDLADFDDLAFNSIRVTDKGILFYLSTYMSAVQGAFKDRDNESQNTSVLGTKIYKDDNSREIWLFYSDVYIINTKTTGEGTITATESEAKEGTQIRFTVTPREGYVLSAIKVIDAEGNVLTFTDYTFTMPSADVTIEAVFVLAATNNPNTGDIAIIAITILAILSSIILIVQKIN